MSMSPTRTTTEKVVFDLDADEVAELVHKQLVLEHPHLAAHTSDTVFTCTGFENTLRCAEVTFTKTIEMLR